MQNVLMFMKKLYQRILKADVFGLSAQLAYFFLLSLFPFLLFLVTLFGYLPVDEGALISIIETYAPGEITQLIESNITQLANTQSGGLLSIGIIGTLWSASNGVNAITRSFNKAYEVKVKRPFFISRLIAIGLTVAMVFVIATALLLPVFGRMIGVYLFSFVNLSDNFLDIWNTLRWVISSVIFFIVLLALYKLAPYTRVRIKHAVWGALFATFGWQSVSLGFSFYVNNLGNYSTTYGSLGTVIVLMIWFYLSGIIINVGGVINAVIAKWDEEKV